RGFFRRAIVSGGLTPGDTRSECQVIKQAMVAGGVPAALILEEHRATNTGENVIFSLPVLDAALDRQSIKSVICLGKICTARRYPMTLHRHWPEVEKMLLTINPYGAPVERWYTDALFRERVLLEWRKIEPYKARGYIADWP
ncbi:MAG: YdcF family protein, partial [Reyranella sp.]|nr:YdcF family protein [Reyranella sp.]